MATRAIDIFTDGAASVSLQGDIKGKQSGVQSHRNPISKLIRMFRLSKLIHEELGDVVNYTVPGIVSVADWPTDMQRVPVRMSSILAVSCVRTSSRVYIRTIVHAA